MSSRAADYLGRILQGGEDFASNIAFEATDNLTLALSVSGAATHILPGPDVMTKPDQDDAIEGRIGLAIAAAVEPVPVGLSGGSWYRVHPAQRCEGGLRVETIRIVPCGNHECRRSVGSYAEDAEQAWRSQPGEAFHLDLQVLDLIA